MDYVLLFNGISIAYVEDVNYLSEALLEVKPTVLAAVPRVFEKIYARIMEKGSKNTGVKRKLFDWGMNVAKRAAPWRCGIGSASPLLKLQWAAADKLVYSKIRAGTGGNLRIVFSGGAPLSKDLAEFFWSIGILIYQGYGLTETSPVLTSNYPKNRVGSSGKPIANVLISIAPDGEILAKGPCVMQGYYQQPGRHARSPRAKTAGSTPATSAISIPTTISSSPIAKKIYSKPPRENLLRPSPSRTR